MDEASLIKTLQATIESQNKIIEGQNKTIESLKEELKRTNENMEYLIKKLYGRKPVYDTLKVSQIIIENSPK